MHYLCGTDIGSVQVQRYLLCAQYWYSSTIYSLSRREECCKNKLFACLYVHRVKKTFLTENIKIPILTWTKSMNARLFATANSREWSTERRGWRPAASCHLQFTLKNSTESSSTHTWDQTTTDDIHKCYAILCIELFVYG